MIGILWRQLGIGKYLVLASLAAGAYWFVWDTGRGFERARWERISAEEVARQAEIMEDAHAAGELAAERLLNSETRRRELVRRLSNEALKDPRADDTCLGPAGVMRLNSVGNQAQPD